MLDLALFLLLGITSGLLAGLFGVGGGAIVVPGLLFIFEVMGVPQNGLMQLAAGTSLMILVCTASGSAIKQKQLQTVVWPILIRMLPWIVLGVIVGAVAAKLIHTSTLRVIFAIFLFAVGMKMALRIRPKPGENTAPSHAAVRKVAAAIGVLSGLLGVGGGTISMPFLVHYRVPIKQAVGTTTWITLYVALIGAISYTVLGWQHHLVSWSSGYIYWPAVLCVAPLSVLFAHYGVRLGQRMNPETLRRLLALLLILLAVKMSNLI